MIVKRIKTPQLKTNYTNWKGQATFYVNDLYTKGLEMGSFVRLEAGTADGEEKSVLTYAGTVDKTYDAGVLADGAVTVKAGRAIGFLYDSSVRDQYERRDNITNETKMYPYGVRQQDPMVIIPNGVLELYDTEDKLAIVGKSGMYFRTLDKTILASAISAYDNTAKTITLNGKVTGIKAGEKVEAGGNTSYTTDVTYDSGTDKTVITLTTGLGNVTVDLTFKSTLFDYIYTADNMAGEVPFTLVPKTEEHKIGKVVSGFAVEYDIR